MSFVSIDSNTIKVGDPLVKDTLDVIKSNFDDHELRINSLATTGGTVFIHNDLVSFIGYNSSYPYFMYYMARQDFSINDFRAQLRSKQGITTGNLTLRLEKSIDTNDANFATILSTDLVFDFSTDAEHSVKTGTINPSLNDINTGEILRVKVISVPTNTFGYNYSGEIMVSIGAQ
jgi:hypothetical protein